MSRIWLSLAVVVVLNLVLLRGKDAIVAAMGVLVFPLLILLMGISLYLVPTWQPEHFVSELANTQFNSPKLWHSLWLAVPAMVFSFSHAPIISSYFIIRINPEKSIWR